MDIENIEKLYRFAARTQKRLGIKEGDETSWYVKVEGGETHRYFINGVKSPEEIEEDILAAFLWMWNLKDHVKNYCERKGATKKWVEAEINADIYLCICGDIANRTKHALLKDSRSNKFPTLGRLSYQIPQQSFKSITFKETDVTIDSVNAEHINLEMPVLSGDGEYLGDAFKYIDYGLRAWERIIDRAKGM